MGDEREGRRRSLAGAGPLLGQLHSLPSAEAERRERKTAIRPYTHNLYKRVEDKHNSPCGGAEAVKGETGSRE